MTTHAFVTSRLNYCNIFSDGLPLKCFGIVWELQLVHYVATTRLLSGLSTTSSNRSISSHMNLLGCYATGVGVLPGPPALAIRMMATSGRAFSRVAPQLWNSFPRKICFDPSLFPSTRFTRPPI